MCEEALGLYLQRDDRFGIQGCLINLLRIAQARGDADRMLSLGREVLPISRDQGSPVNVATALDPLAWAIHVGGDPARATRLLAAADGIREGLGLRLRVGADRARVEAELLALRSALGEEAFAEVWAAGQTLTMEQAVAEALEAIDEAQQESGTLL